MDTVTVRKKFRKTAKEIPFFPDEIVTSILIRLPVKSVMKCRLVCRNWRDITLDRDFVELHLRNSISAILVTISKGFSLSDFFALDKWWECAKTRFTIQKFPFNSDDFLDISFVLFSHAGFIVLTEGNSFVILNPTRPRLEYVTITLCDQLRSSNICALYYHPLLKEYCCLLRIKIYKSKSYHDPSELIEYKLLNLSSNPSLKTIINPFDRKLKDNYAKSLFICNYLYWMLKSEQDYKCDILAFDIITEEFMVIPCPVPLNTDFMSHQTHLVNNDGMLSFVLFLPGKIIIWRLEDRAEQVWTLAEYTISLKIYEGVGIISVVNGILAFQSRGRFSVCNLKEGTVKNYPKRKYGGDVLFFPHQMSLVSLKNCKSALFINRKYKVLS